MWAESDSDSELLTHTWSFSLRRSCFSRRTEEDPGSTVMKMMVMKMMVIMVMKMMMVTDAARVLSGQTVCSGVGERTCYKIAYFHEVSSRVAFREARRVCQMDGGSLLSLESQEEQDHIQNLLQELRSGAVGGAGGGAGGIADGDFWIGLTRADGLERTEPGASCPQLYRWTDGSSAPFRNWYLDEPSCGGEACVVMYHQPAALPGVGGAYLHQWNDDRCNMKHNFICKYRADDVTAGGRSTEATAAAKEPPAGGQDVRPQVTSAATSGMLLVYIIIPTIPLILLLLVATSSCCIQMVSRSNPRTKTDTGQSNFWISKMPKHDGMEV